MRRLGGCGGAKPHMLFSSEFLVFIESGGAAEGETRKPNRARPLPCRLHACGAGWVRAVSGIQSLICLYLFALWIVLLVSKAADEVTGF